MSDANRSAGLRQAAAVLRGLIEPGLLGRFTWFDAVEVFRFDKTEDCEPGVACNVFSIFVAEAGDPSAAPTSFFRSKLKTIRGLPASRFGVIRRPITPEQLLAAIEFYATNEVWQPVDTRPLQVGKLWARSDLFCPADTSTEVPLNGVLKNNFWGGAYVVELADDIKEGVRELVTNNSMLEEFSEWLMTIVPLDIARVPDRIGNIIFQVPSMGVIADFRRRPEKPVELKLAWQRELTSRPVSGDYRVEQDGLIVSAARFDYPVGQAQLNVPMVAGDIRFSVWDNHKNLLLAASSQPNASDGRYSLHTTTSVKSDNPRRWISSLGPCDTTEDHEIPIMEPMGDWRSTAQRPRPQEVNWRARRQLLNKMKQLVDRRKFVQYGADGSNPAEEHRRALGDIRALIRNINQGAVYLWDPYLSSNDILNTLAFCPDAGTELRALTAGKQAPQKAEKQEEPLVCSNCGVSSDTDAPGESATNQNAKTDSPAHPISAREKWIAEQRSTLDTAFVGDAKMKLEYRITGGFQSDFHDRFLIFPGLGRARSRVWSLGTSINHIGTLHCILQEVEYPEMVVEAFQQFWDRCSKQSHLIWNYK